MKKAGKALLCTSAALVGAGLGYLWLIAPGHASRSKKAPFLGRNLAHRGLYDRGAGIPENSLAAFRAAAEKGYGVELDVRLTRDGQVVVSHDNNLLRMTGRGMEVDGCTLAELRALRLDGTGETVPLLADALDILQKADVPAVVELKQCRRWRELCRKTLAILDERGGDVCVESFDPRIVAWFRFHAGDLLRGQLTAQADELGAGAVGNFLLSRVLINFLGRPHFIAHHVGSKSFSVRLCERLGAMRICWTAHDRLEEDGNDAVIFEHCRPPVRFR